MAQTEAQKRATKRYREKNKHKTRYMSYRTTARAFIKNWATADDLKELLALIAKKSKE